MNYSLNKKLNNEESKEGENYKYLEPKAKPIDPPYKAFLARRNEINNKY